MMRVGILGPRAEAHHVPGELGHRLDQEGVEGEIDERRGDDRDQDREAENVEAVADHRRVQRRLLHHHLDEQSGAEAGLADDADDAVARLGIDHQRIGDQREPGGVAKIVGGVDLGGHILLEDQPAGIGALDGDGLDLGALEEIVAEHLRQLAAGRGLGGKRRDLRILEARRQPLPPEVRHRGHEHEHLGHHDEQDGEDQQFAGQPEDEAPRTGRAVLGVRGLLVRFQLQAPYRKGLIRLAKS